MAKPKRRSSKPAQDHQARALPSKDQIIAFIEQADGKVGKREIARAFGVRGDDRIDLKRLLDDMSREGAITGRRKALNKRGSLPPVAVLDIVTRDADGDLVAQPAVWKQEGERPRARIEARDRAHSLSPSELGIGDRVLARIRALDEAQADGVWYLAQPIKKLPRERRRLVGIYRKGSRGSGHVLPVDRKQLREWPVDAGDEGGARNGDLVRFDIQPRGRSAISGARIVETLGNPADQRQISLIAIHAHGLPDAFPDAVIREAETISPIDADGRTDLRGLALVTIDPVDARDHDDAVHAASDTDPKNAGGHIITVAIADVAEYVRAGSALDQEALNRGNSVYFPDRVVPMLPERLSNDLCSLREGEDRPCLAVRLVIDRHGKLRRHTFMRAIMRSAAKLSYQEAQAAFDGRPRTGDDGTVAAALTALWTAYQCVAAARDERGPLDLDLPERRILLDGDGRVDRVVVPQRLEAHRLIEAFMILANVAAAEALEAKAAPVMYRVHEPPSKEKLKALRDFLQTVGLKLPSAGQLRPKHFNQVIAAAKPLPIGDLVSEVVLRSQSQADYRPDNDGHFGLNLARYAHFTSPIRRYADLIVHRALIGALGLGAGGLVKDEAKSRLAEVARKISEAERRAMAAERETVDRLTAAYLADRIGATFEARISGVTRSGLFVRLAETGAEGFVPISTLGDDYFVHAETAHALVGTSSGAGYRLGDDVTVRLVEAIPTAGALRFEMLSKGRRGMAALVKAHGGRARTSRSRGFRRGRRAS